MSLLIDAMKEKQREAAARSRPDENPQAVEGFFPYVSSSSNRAGSRRALLFGVSAAVVAVLAIPAWLMWSSSTKAPPQKRAPIILPPPVTVSKTPPAVDSTKTPVIDTEVASAPARTETAAPSDRPPSRVDSRPNTPRSESRSANQGATATNTAAAASVVAVERRDSVPAAPVRVITPRVDYEGQATALFNAGDLNGAREKFALATRFAPNARAWTNYGVTLQRLGDFVGAAAAYQSAIGIDANYLEAWLYQGRLAAEQKDVARAIPLFQRARAINPRNAEVNVELARLEYDAHNWTEAKRFAEEALRGDISSVRAYWFLAVASDPLKDVDGSIRGYTGFLKYVGDAPDQAPFVGWARQRLAELRVKP